MSPSCGSPYSYWNPPQVWNAFLPPVWHQAEFTSQITQNTARTLQIPWRFHIPYHRWSSGKVKRAHRVLKETLTKSTIELHQDWTKLLPLALLKVWALPKKASKRQSVRGHVWEAHNSFRTPPLPWRSQTAIPPSFSLTCPDARCPLKTYG